MTKTDLTSSEYLSDLEQKIHTLPPDEASYFLLEASAIILFAGFPEIAYQGFVKLIEGELKISEFSVLAYPIKLVIPVLCYFLKISCPSIYSEPEFSWLELERQVYPRLRNIEIGDLLILRPSLVTLTGDRSKKKLKNISDVDTFIQNRWRSVDSLAWGLNDSLWIVYYRPKFIQKLVAGILKNQINISQEQAQEFIDSVNRRKYIPPTTGFIPTVDDWKNLLEKWNQAIFDNLEEEDIRFCESEYPSVFNSKSCLQPGAKEEEIAQLETKLAVNLPLSYRNFLLASNGFTILYEGVQFYGTNETKWFIEENKYWTEGWDDKYEVEDERYLLYGKHQGFGFMRCGYMKTALQISETEDGDVYLLNPKIIDSRKEWEAWDVCSSYFGVYRYRSFWEMIEDKYQQCLKRWTQR